MYSIEMRFFPDGPNIPPHLLEQQSLGNVIFFCGAGVSMPAGLKDFWGLTKEIIERLNGEKARQAFEAEDSFDRVFNLLNREFGRAQIDQQIYNILKTPRRPKIDCHKWILQLSTGAHGRPQIVTTNFDLLFEKADPKIRRIIAPALPDLDLQPRFDGIVYLHGRLEKPERNTAGNYVISSSDFGRAYLSEGWAGRFVKALRERFTLVFLGYRAEDPPMRYLLEGLNSKGEDAFDSPIYAFVPGDAEDAEEEWHDRGVTPICYDESPQHQTLWATLEAWAAAATDPASWYDRIISLAQRSPSDLKPFERGQVAQLVTTKQGAKLFAEATPRPPAEWMCVFDSYTRYAKPRSRSWEDREEIDPLDLFGLDDDPQRPDPQPNGQTKIEGVNLLFWRQGDASFQERISLIGAGAGWSDPLPERLFHLARWFASVSHQPAAVWWAAGWPTLPLNFLWHIQRNFEQRDGSYPAAAAQFWRLYLEFHSLAQPNDMNLSWYDFKRLVEVDGWSNSTLRSFERQIDPKVLFERYGYGAPCPPKDGWDKVHPAHVFTGKVQALDRHGDELNIPSEHLAAIVETVRRSLIRCSSLLDEVGTLWWRTPTLHPTGERGETFFGRKTLYFLWFKELFVRLVEENPSAAKIEMSKWPIDDLYFFGKLGIYALMFPELSSGAEFEALISGVSDQVFWTRENQRELLFTLRARWGDLTNQQKRRIERRIIAGPSKWEDEKPAQYRKRRAADAASRLRWLQLNSCKLSVAAEKRLDLLIKVDQRWNDNWATSADDSLGPRGGVVERVTELRGLDQLPISEIVATAVERTEDRLGELRDFRPFEGLVAAHPFKAVSALRWSLRRDDFKLQFWQNLLSDWPDGTSVRLLWLVALTISRLGPEQSLELRYYLPRWLRKHLPVLMKSNRTAALRLFDSLSAPYSDADPKMTSSGIGHTSIGGIIQDRSEVSISKAINSPVGILTECLWDLLPNKASNRLAMPRYIGDRLEALFAVPGDGGGHAVCIIAQHMGWIDYCYHSWTERVMLPLFALEHPKSEAAWHGLAADHNWLRSDTLKALNFSFIGVLTGEAPWKLDDSELRRHVQRLVMLTRPKDEGGTIVTFAQAREVLMKIEDQKRADAIWTLSDILEQDKKGDEWENFVRPFIESAWPRQVRYRTESASRGFSRLVECSGPHFPKAVKILLDLDLLRPVPHLDMITYRLSNRKKEEGEKDFAAKFPRETLLLLDALIADDRANRPYELGKVLEVMAEVDPTLRHEKAWRRLQELTV